MQETRRVGRLDAAQVRRSNIANLAETVMLIEALQANGPDPNYCGDVLKAIVASELKKVARASYVGA